jgi:hypothetical protein
MLAAAYVAILDLEAAAGQHSGHGPPRRRLRPSLLDGEKGIVRLAELGEQLEDRILRGVADDLPVLGVGLERRRIRNHAQPPFRWLPVSRGK